MNADRGATTQPQSHPLIAQLRQHFGDTVVDVGVDDGVARATIGSLSITQTSHGSNVISVSSDHSQARYYAPITLDLRDDGVLDNTNLQLLVMMLDIHRIYPHLPVPALREMAILILQGLARIRYVFLI